jgi:hypothetical protein
MAAKKEGAPSSSKEAPLTAISAKSCHDPAVAVKAAILAEFVKDDHRRGNEWLQRAQRCFAAAMSAKASGDRRGYEYHLSQARECLDQHDIAHSFAFREQDRLDKLVGGKS